MHHCQPGGKQASKTVDAIVYDQAWACIFAKHLANDEVARRIQSGHRSAHYEERQHQASRIINPGEEQTAQSLHDQDASQPNLCLTPQVDPLNEPTEKHRASDEAHAS
jgi:hypothetical protein